MSNSNKVLVHRLHERIEAELNKLGHSLTHNIKEQDAYHYKCGQFLAYETMLNIIADTVKELENTDE